MPATIGILAHVDAGKTTLSEQLLFQAGRLRTIGRVDHGSAFLDDHALEQKRGITIFSGQASFQWRGKFYYLLDTPGHVDFSPEMERVLSVLDAAVVVVSATEGIQGHTETIWRLLREHHIPTLFFLNKADRETAQPERILTELQMRFSPLIRAFGADDLSWREWVAEQDEKLFARYFNDQYDPALWMGAYSKLFETEQVFPCYTGSALSGQGVEALLDGMHALLRVQYDPEKPFSARCYKVRHTEKGVRLSYVKVMSGVVRVRGELAGEKVSEIRFYNGARYDSAQTAQAGDLCALAGPQTLQAGSALSSAPVLSAKVLYDSAIPSKEMLRIFSILEDEEPTLHAHWEEELGELQVHVMGTVQLEILEELVRERFGVAISFGQCGVLYQETITGPVIGSGHFEPLRHYAEVHLHLSPGPRGSGVTFESACKTDDLAQSWQNLIETHVFEREHRGVLAGAPLTDVHVTLLSGRAHLKHTEGGDFREAVYRAIRQGLRKAHSILLEPWYAFAIEADAAFLGRILSDIQRLKGIFEPPEQMGARVRVQGRAPAASMLYYGQELASFTKGSGSISMRFDCYEPCHNAGEVVSQTAYDPERDTVNTADSVFCSHGAGFMVKWDQADSYMHIKPEKGWLDD